MHEGTYAAAAGIISTFNKLVYICDSEDHVCTII